MTEQEKKGVLLALLTAVISGGAIFYNKLVVTSGIDPLVFNILKNGGTGIALSLLLLSSLKIKSLAKLSRTQWKKLVSISLIGGSIPFILYFEGLKNASAVNANLIHKTMFIWVAVFGLSVLKERVTKLQIGGYILVATSNIFIGGLPTFQWSRAELMILVATLLWTAENIISKMTLREIDSSIVAWARMFLGTIVLIAVALAEQKLSLIGTVTQTQWHAVGVSIVFLTGYVLSWYRALKYAPATLATSMLILSTPITNILSASFLTKQFLSLQDSISIAGTGIGLLLISRVSEQFFPHTSGKRAV